jgi:hypothetical protein
MHHVAITEEFELRRSPGTEVSQAIAAVNDDRPFFVQRMFGVVQQPRERQVHRAANGGRAMLMGGQHVDHLTARGDDTQNIMMIDNAHTSILLARGRDVWRAKRAAIRDGSPLAETTFWSPQ